MDALSSGCGDAEMPSYHIRQSIAAKVTAKKTAKGYTLSDENCDKCEMSLMTMDGNTECKVCPAIKKWVERKNEEDSPAISPPEMADEREAAEDAESDEEDREGSIDGDEVVERKARADSEEFSFAESKEGDDDDRALGRSFSDDSEDTSAIRERARQIIMAARGRGKWGSSDSPNDDDDDDDDDANSVKSSQLSWDNEGIALSKSIDSDDDTLQERAGEIINQARKHLEAENDLPEEMLSPREDLDRAMSPQHAADEEKKESTYSNDALVNDLQDTESDSSPDDVASPRLQNIGGTYSSDLEDVLNQHHGLSSLDASIAIQSAARGFLAKKILMGMKLKAIEQAYHRGEEDYDASEHHHDEENYEEYQQDEDNNDATESHQENFEETQYHHGDEKYEEKEYMQGEENYEEAQYHRGEEHFEGENYPQEEEKAQCHQGGEQFGDAPIVPSTSEHFEPLGVTSPTGDDDEDWENPHVGNHGNAMDKEKGKRVEHVQESHDTAQVTTNNEDVAHGGLQDDAAGHGATQEQAHPSLPAKVTSKSVGEEFGPDETHQDNAMDPQLLKLSASDYASVLKKEASQVKAVAPQRGLFAQLACKFDDAVTDAIGRVHSIVNCSAMGEPGFTQGEFEAAYETERRQLEQNNREAEAATSSSSQVKYDAQAKYDAQIMRLTPLGWRVTEASCNRCNRAILIRPGDGNMMCAACDDIEVPNQTNIPPPRQAPPRPESHPEPSCEPANQAPEPANVPADLFLIEMHRHLQMGWVATNNSCPYCSSQLMRKPNDDLDQCLACGPIFPPQKEAAPTPTVPAFTSSTPLSGMGGIQQSNNANLSETPLRDISATHNNSTVNPNKLAGKPPMPVSSNQARPPMQPAKQNHPHMPMSTFQGHSPMPMSTIQGHSTVPMSTMSGMTQFSFNPPSVSSAQLREVSAATPTQEMIAAQQLQLQMMQAAHIQNQMELLALATRNSFAQGDDAKENAPGDANKQLEDAKNRIEDAKKFIMSRNANRMNMPPVHNMTPSGVRPQMSMTPSGVRPQMSMMTPSGVRPQMSMMTPSGVRPQMSMTPSGVREQMLMMSLSGQANALQSAINNLTPGGQSVQSFQPGSVGVQGGASIFRPQPNFTPGSHQIRAPTPEMRAMGSLMSPGTDTNDEAANKMVANNSNPAAAEQMNVMAHSEVSSNPAVESGEPQNDGYLTPQMPGRYFFASSP